MTLQKIDHSSEFGNYLLNHDEEITNIINTGKDCNRVMRCVSDVYSGYDYTTDSGKERTSPSSYSGGMAIIVAIEKGNLDKLSKEFHESGGVVHLISPEHYRIEIFLTTWKKFWLEIYFRNLQIYCIPENSTGYQGTQLEFSAITLPIGKSLAENIRVIGRLEICHKDLFDMMER